MADVQKLVSMLKELDDQLVSCMKCGMCQAVCPVFKESGKESDVTRGKLALLDGLANEILKSPEEVNKKLNKCLLCGTCEANCPSGVSATDIFLKARAVLTGYLGLPPAQKIIFRTVLANPKLMNNLLGLGSKFQGLFTKEVDSVIGASCARFEAPLIGDRHFKGLAAKPLHKIVPAKDSRSGQDLKAAFFPGCVVDKIFPSVGEATLKVLDHHNVGVYMPEGQACCGIPALSSGDPEGFQKLVAKNMEVFDDRNFDYLLTPCATCTSTIKKLWRKFAKLQPKHMYAVEDLAQKAMDINQFLVDVVGVQAAEPGPHAIKATYHDPCHLKNSLGVTAQPRTLISANPAYAFTEMTDAGTCCGCGGSFNLKHYDTSSEIGKIKAENIVNSGAAIAATGCPACMMQISDMLSKSGAPIPVKHAIELYAETV